MRRALLLVALLVGLLSLYLLSAHDGRAGHHVVAQVSASVNPVPTATPAGVGAVVTTASADLSDHSGLMMCAVLMLAGVAVGLLLQRRRTDASADSPATRRVLLGVLRGPPNQPSRLALCVERI